MSAASSMQRTNSYLSGLSNNTDNTESYGEHKYTTPKMVNSPYIGGLLGLSHQSLYSITHNAPRLPIILHVQPTDNWNLVPETRAKTSPCQISLDMGSLKGNGQELEIAYCYLYTAHVVRQLICRDMSNMDLHWDSMAAEELLIVCQLH